MTLHEMMPCEAPCERALACGHRCLGQCGLPCQGCTYEVSKILLDCGHPYDLTCSESTKPICKQIVETKRLECGHDIDIICSEVGLQPFTCQEKCHKVQKCGHQCERTCGVCCTEDIHEVCAQLCDAELACGHRCTAR